MHKGFKFLALTLVVLGGLLAWMAFLLSAPAKPAAAPQPVVANPMQAATTRMVVARQALPAGHLLQAGDVQLQEAATLPPGALEQEASVQGRTLAQPVAAGEPILAARLLGGVAVLLQPGERAVAIKVDESTAVGHKLTPGDWVDVLVVLRKDNQEVAATQARPLLLRKRVLAYGSQLEGARPVAKEGAAEDAARAGQPPRTAVLAVQAQEVSPLLLAERQGQVLLALRHPLDVRDASAEAPVAAPLAVADSTGAVVLEQLARTAAGSVPLHSLSASPPLAFHGLPRKTVSAAPAPRKPGLAVEVIRGNRSETVHY